MIFCDSGRGTLLIMILNKLFLKLILVTQYVSGVLVIAQAQADPNSETPDIPGVTAISQEQHEPASETEEPQVPVTEPAAETPGPQQRPLVVTGVTAIAQNGAPQPTGKRQNTPPSGAIGKTPQDAAIFLSM